MHRQRPGMRSRGFTLLEVLVAFVILLLAFSVMMQIFATGSRGLVATDDINRAVALARADLAEVGVTEPLQTGTQHGELADGFQWERTIDPFPTDEAELSARVRPLYRVTTRIVWRRNGADRQIALSTLRLAPSVDTQLGGG